VSYREALTSTAEHEEIFEREVGGRGQFAHICLRLEPKEQGSGFEFVNELADGQLKKVCRSKC